MQQLAFPGKGPQLKQQSWDNSAQNLLFHLNIRRQLKLRKRYSRKADKEIEVQKIADNNHPCEAMILHFGCHTHI